MAELAYALDLGSSPEPSGWGFESPFAHSQYGTAKLNPQFIFFLDIFIKNI